MKISILMPVYNVQNYLDQSIKSVINQSFDDYELIIINDGSTDNSPKICDEYAKKYPENIQVFHQENQGLTKTRKNLIKKAQGEYILHLDSDDMLKNTLLQTLNEKIEQLDVDVIIYNFSKNEDFSPCENSIKYINSGELSLEFVRETLVNSYEFNSLCNKCIKRDILKDVKNLPEDNFVQNAEDKLGNLRMYDLNLKTYYTNEVYYYYRPNLNSMTNKLPKAFYISEKYVSNVILEYSKKWNISFKQDYYNVMIGFKKINYDFFSSQKLSDKIKTIKEIVKDDFFMNAYKKCDKKLLTYKKRLFLFVIVNTFKF